MEAVDARVDHGDVHARPGVRQLQTFAPLHLVGADHRHALVEHQLVALIVPTIHPGGILGGVTELTYSVPGMHCGNCKAAVDRELRLVGGVREVDVDLDAKRVVVRGDALDDRALRAAIEEAGYEAA
jgi:copper chaperone